MTETTARPDVAPPDCVMLAVEGASSGVDGSVHVRLRRVADLSQDLLGRRVDVAERASCAVDELSVDQHSRFEVGLVGHGAPL